MSVDNYHWMRDIGLLAWLAKDLGWVLLLPILAWPAALIAVVVESHLAISEWPGSSTGLRVHTFAELSWLVGNCIWMSSELLFDKKPRSIFPWYDGTVLENDAKAYNIGANISLVILVVGFAALLGFYILRIIQHMTGGRSEHHKSFLTGNPQDDTTAPPQQETLVFGYIPEEIYTRMFLFPWIAKDIFWNVGWFYSLIFFAVMVVIMALDYLRRYGGPHFWAELFWFCGNAVWAFSELDMDGPAPHMRLIAAGLLSAGLACVITPSIFTGLGGKWSKDGRLEAAQERQPLVPAGASASSGGFGSAARGL